MKKRSGKKSITGKTSLKTVKNRYGHFLEELKQGIYPKDFRIRLPYPEPDRTPVSSRPTTTPRAETEHAPVPSSEPAVDTKLLADLATALWRIRAKLPDPKNGEPSREMRALIRNIESMHELLTDRGIEIKDDTGQKYVPGLPIKVIAFQPTPGLNVEIIIETVKPRIYFQGRLIQRGEVFVAAPESPQPEVHPGPQEAAPTAPIEETPPPNTQDKPETQTDTPNAETEHPKTTQETNQE